MQPRKVLQVDGARLWRSLMDLASIGATAPLAWGGAVTGTAGNLAFSSVGGSTGGGVTVTNTSNFSGALANGVISGTVTHSKTELGANVSGSGSTSMSVTLR